MEKYNTQKSQLLHQETKKYLLDGVGSSFHVTSYRDYPITIDHAKGSKLYDIDGNEYIDYVLGFGPMLLGHCNEHVNKAVAAQLDKGSHFSAPNRDLGRLSKRLTEIIPSAEMVTFQNSGTEVVMYALRLARAYTGKYKIIKFEGQYHGWSDEEKVSIDASNLEELGERSHPNKIIHTKGQRLSSADDLIVLPWNDLEIMEKTLEAQHDEIAAVIMEPVMFDSGPILPKEGYLQGMRRLTEKYHVLLIFDEVITGFRLSLGGAQQYFDVTPDISTFAKAIANGFPFGVVAGKKEIMECGIHASGTFNGNPIGTAAANAVIDELSKPGIYEKFEKLGLMLEKGFQKLSLKYEIPIFTAHMGSIFIMFFGFQENADDFRDWITKADIPFYKEFCRRCESYGIRLTDKRGREYLSTAHTEEDISKTLHVADVVLSEMKQELLNSKS